MVHDSITTGGPLFRRIADSLADAIVRGDYPAGSRLPSEFALMRMFGASRFTIREALVDLRARTGGQSTRLGHNGVASNAPNAEVHRNLSINR